MIKQNIRLGSQLGVHIAIGGAKVMGHPFSSSATRAPICSPYGKLSSRCLREQCVAPLTSDDQLQGVPDSRRRNIRQTSTDTGRCAPGAPPCPGWVLAATTCRPLGGSVGLSRSCGGADQLQRKLVERDAAPDISMSGAVPCTSIQVTMRAVNVLAQANLDRNCPSWMGDRRVGA